MGLQATIENAVTAAFDAADDLIGKFTVIRRTKVKDVDTNATTVTEVTTANIDGLFDDIKDGDFNGKNIEMGDRVIYLKPATTYSVRADDRIIDPNGTEWRVKNAGGVSPAGKVLLYKLHVTS